MRKIFYTKILLTTVLIISMTACKELEPVLDKVKPILEQQVGSTSTQQFSTQQVIQAIKQALSQGVSDSVNLLGSSQGFSLSEVYRIPVPQQLEKPAELLRQFGQGKRVDEFENRLNLAAEKAVSKAIPVFSSAIRNMSVQDALGIMQGKDDAATVYFRQQTESRLRNKFRPVINTATDETGLTSSYKSLKSKIAVLAPSYSDQLVDIDEYVLDNSMDALFDRISIEEKLIREQPFKRTTELMKSVFGYYAK